MFYDDYEKALRAAEKELADLLLEQKRVEEEILNRRRLISSLVERLKDINPVPPLTRSQETIQRQLVENFHRYTLEQSITEDVRKIIRSAGVRGIPKDRIREELSKLGNSIENHSNPAGTINSIIKRLIEKREVEEVEQRSGTPLVVAVEPFFKTLGKFRGPPVQEDE